MNLYFILKVIASEYHYSPNLVLSDVQNWPFLKLRVIVYIFIPEILVCLPN